MTQHISSSKHTNMSKFIENHRHLIHLVAVGTSDAAYGITAALFIAMFLTYGLPVMATLGYVALFGLAIAVVSGIIASLTDEV